MSNGSVNKGHSNYRAALLNKIGTDPEHPINQGIHMEAHHLISQEAIKESRLGPFLVDCNYHINTLKNLAFLPATLPGACHLEVQIHRGNHIAQKKEQGNDDDDAHPESYHELICSMLLALQRKKLSNCVISPNSNDNEVILEVNKLSNKIIKKIHLRYLKYIRLLKKITRLVVVIALILKNIKKLQLTVLLRTKIICLEIILMRFILNSKVAVTLRK